MTLTRHEATALNQIVHNEFQPANGGLPKSFDDLDAVWSADLDVCHGCAVILTGKVLSAACSNLVQKGLAVSSGAGTERTIRLTREGYDAWQAAFPQERA